MLVEALDQELWQIKLQISHAYIEEFNEKGYAIVPIQEFISWLYNTGLRAALLVSFCSLKTPLSANPTSK